MIQDEIRTEARSKMKKAVEHLREQFARVRTGRANPGLVEKLKIDYYGAEVPLQQIAGISVPEARMLQIMPYDQNAVEAVEKAILESDLGINPNSDGKVIRLAFPQLTEERRKDLVKMVRQRAEEARVSVRNARRQARHELEEFRKEGEISQDDLDRAEKQLDKLTQDQVDEVDRLLERKEHELMEV